MATHDYHQALEGYDERAIYQDGCGECEARVKEALGGFLKLDASRQEIAWEMMIDARHGAGSGGEHFSQLDTELTAALYPVAVLMERAGLDPTTLSFAGVTS